MGRRSIKMQMVENRISRQITFSKRTSGLFIKANELVSLCAVQMAIIVFSPGKKPFSFGNPCIETVLAKFLSENGTDGASGHDSGGNDSQQSQARVEREKASHLDNGSIDGVGGADASNSQQRQARVQRLHGHLDELKQQIQAEKEKREMSDRTMIENYGELNPKIPIESLTLEELEKLKAALEAARVRAKRQANDLEASSSLLLLSNNADDG